MIMLLYLAEYVFCLLTKKKRVFRNIFPFVRNFSFPLVVRHKVLQFLIFMNILHQRDTNR